MNAHLPLAFKVSDLGIAKVIDEIKKKLVGVSSGTPAYMAPEQFLTKNGKNIVEDPTKIDSYALGVILFRLIFKSYPWNQNSYLD